MPFHIKRFPALLITLAILFATFVNFASKLLTNSLPDKYNEFLSDSVYTDVTLYRNNFGIPHIIARTDNDMFFMLGFTEAQDRLWQMDFLRRTAKGETAEIFGNTEIPYDQFIKSLEIEKISRETWRAMSNDSKIALKSFSNGVNYYISKYAKKLPFEFGYLEYTPSAWQPTDCIAIFKLLSLKMSVGFSRDLLMGKIAGYSGTANADMLIPTYPQSAPHIFDSITYSQASTITPQSGDTTTSRPISVAGNAASAGFDISDNLLSITQKITGTSASVGSNIWAVVMKNSNLKPENTVIACDPHLHLDIPSIWYEAQLTSGRINLTGILLAGTPFMLIGRNNEISWGFANAMCDDFDYYYEQLDDKNHNYYYTDSSAKPQKFKFTIDTIKVRNEPDYLYYQRSTNRSKVISDYHPENSQASKKSHLKHPINNPKAGEYLERSCLTYAWAGSRPTDFFNPLLDIYVAGNYGSFGKALDSWHSPVLNFIYGDKEGNIALKTAGDIPVRRSECNPDRPNPAWKPSSSWNGFISSDQLKSIVNPSRNVVFAANNKWSRNSSAGTTISNYWDAPYRAIRLDSLLRNFISYSSRDAQIMQNDLFSVQAENIVKQLLPVLTRHYSELTLAEKRCFEKLKHWNFNINIGFRSSIIFNQLYLQLADEIFKIQFGQTSFKKIMQMPSLVAINIDNVLNNPEAPLRLHNRNGNVHNPEVLLYEAFKKAVTTLIRKYSTCDINQWNYGSLHYVELQHPFSKFAILQSTFSLAKTPVGGNASTLNNAEYNLSDPFKVVTGASCRFITDMNNKFVYVAIPGGSCGQVYSQYYGNQFQIWVYGGYVKLKHSANPSPDIDVKVASIRPRNE